MPSKTVFSMILGLLASTMICSGEDVSIKNGGFESEANGFASDWTIRQRSGTAKATLDATAAYEGERAVRMSCEAPGDMVVISQKLTLPPGKLYAISLSVKGDGISGDRGARVQVHFLDGMGKPVAKDYCGNALTGTFDWTPGIHKFRTPPGVVKVDLQLLLLRATGKAWFDNVRLKELPDERTVIPPALQILPVDMTSTSDRLPLFRWNNRYDVKSYALELSQDASFKDGVIRIEGITPSSKDVIDASRDYAITHTDYKLKDSDIPAGLSGRWLFGLFGHGLKDGRWHWRVGYEMADGKSGDTSRARWFMIDPAGKDKISFPSRREHPYLYFTKAELPAIKAKLDSTPEYAKFKKSLLAKADAMVKAPNPIPSEVAPLDAPAPGVNFQHGSFMSLAGATLANLEPLGFAYQITGDRRYADKAKEIMLSLAKLERWTGPWFVDGKHFAPRWRSALETGMIARSYAMSYDWIYETLTPDERKILRDGLVKNGLDPLRDWFDPDRFCEIERHQVAGGPGGAGSNWNMVCGGAAGVAALALLYETPEAKRYVCAIRDRTREWLSYKGGDYQIFWDCGPKTVKRIDGPTERNFDEDGAYLESIGYMDYAMRYLLGFSCALKNVSGDDVIFKHIPDNMLDHCVYMMYESGSDGESITTPAFGDTAGGHCTPEVYCALMKYKGDRNARLLFDKAAKKPLSTLQAFLWDSQDAEAALPPKDGAKIFRGVGQAVMRSGWGPMQDMLAIKYHQNRGHLDIGGFTLSALGRQFIIDSGSAGYTTRKYSEYLSKTEAHNVVMVDGRRQERVDGQITAFIKTPSLAYTCGELKAAYPAFIDSWKRHVLYLRPDCYVMLDEMRGSAPHTYDWLLHYDGKLKIEPDSATITNRDAKLLVKMAGHKELKADIATVSIPEEKIDYSYLKIRPDARKKDFDFLTLMLPYADEKELEGVKDISTGDCKGFAISRLSGKDEVAYSPNGRIVCGGLSGEAGIALSSRNAKGKLYQFAVIGGKSLLIDGQETLSSDASVSGGMSLLNASAKGAFESEKGCLLKLACNFKPMSAFIDGEKAAFTNDERGMTSIALPAGTHEIVFTAGKSDVVPEFKMDLPMRKLELKADASMTDAAKIFENEPANAENILAAKASSVKESNLPDQALDSSTDPANCWVASDAASAPHWLELDFKKPIDISEVAVCHHTDYPMRTVDFDVQVWDSASGAWVTKAEVRGNTGRMTVSKFKTAKTDKLRLLIMKGNPSNGNARIAEIRWK